MCYSRVDKSDSCSCGVLGNDGTRRKTEGGFLQTVGRTQAGRKATAGGGNGDDFREREGPAWGHITAAIRVVECVITIHAVETVILDL